MDEGPGGCGSRESTSPRAPHCPDAKAGGRIAVHTPLSLDARRRVSPHTPSDRVGAFARSHASAALFADVSGFTSLTERLGSELGARLGADALLGPIDGVYAGITHAVAAAVAMQSAMEELPPVDTSPAEAIRLRLKVGIAAGPARRFLVGDPAMRVLDVLAGRTIDRVATAQAHAASGEIIVDAAVRDRLGRAVRLHHRGATDPAFASIRALRVDVRPLPWADPPPLHPDQARSWLSSPVLERIEASGQYAGDLRSCVPLFAGFAGIDYDADPDAGETLDAWVRWAARVLDGYGGTLVSVGTGDKGSQRFGVFGALVAHDDNATRI